MKKKRLVKERKKKKASHKGTKAHRILAHTKALRHIEPTVRGTKVRRGGDYDKAAPSSLALSIEERRGENVEMKRRFLNCPSCLCAFV